MSQDLVAKSEKRDYRDLFLYELNWSAPDHPPVTVELEDGTSVSATNVSSYQGLRVWEVPAFPGTAVEAQVDREIAKTTTNRLVIFHEPERQAWRWPSRSSRGGGVVSRPARHVHRTGVTDSRFGEKLEAIRLPVDTLLDVNAVLMKVRAAFDVETSNETKRASKLMARMYAAVEKAYPAGCDPKQRDHEISVSLARVLFLLFGDDTEMWTVELFQDFVKDHTARDGSDIGHRLNDLFRVLDTAPDQRIGLPAELVAFPYVNGGIFEEKITLPNLDHEFRTAVLDAAAVDWSTISPAIFGSMFQSVRDARVRRELGEHYTSEENILKTLNPLFLDELRGEFDAAIARETDRKRANALRTLWDKLGEIRYMDPACGCGNFIIVAYRELRELELRIMDALTNAEQGEDAQALETDWTHTLKVTLDHFYGIEIDEWPARIAETAMFLVDRQADLRMRERFGQAPERLPIQRQAQILVGDALEVDWKEFCPPSESVIVAGNPPFLGHISRSAKQTEQLRAAWDGADIGRLDYVTAWYATAMKYYGQTTGRWAFVSTNSVSQGDQVPRLFGPVFRAGWRIKFAHRTFAWSSEAAGKATVHCNILGFDRGEGTARLFHYPTPTSGPVEILASNINGYLADGPNVLVGPRKDPLSPELAVVTFGNMPRDGGHLLIEDEETYREVMADPVAAKYVRRFVGSEELVNGRHRWCLWMTELDPRDVTRSTILAERIEGVRQMRLESKAASTRGMAATPHLFGQRSGGYGTAYLGIPRVVSENRPYFTAARLPADVIPSDRLFTAPDADGFLFGLVSSSMFLTWQFAVGNRLESRPSFSNTLVWNNFPLPDITRGQRAAVAAAGARVSAARESFPTRSLAQLYDSSAMPEELKAAHDSLDDIVDSLFALAPDERTPDGRQRVLFTTFERINAGLLAKAMATRTSRKRT